MWSYAMLGVIFIWIKKDLVISLPAECLAYPKVPCFIKGDTVDQHKCESFGCNWCTTKGTPICVTGEERPLECMIHPAKDCFSPGSIVTKKMCDGQGCHWCPTDKGPWCVKGFAITNVEKMETDTAIRPRQIVSIRNGLFQMNFDAAHEILTRPEVKGKPLAIISIAGATRTGKTFIMNAFIRYLRNKGWRNPNWFNEVDAEITSGPYSSKDGVESGIIIWPEVFQVPIHGGEKAVVLLVNTQGISDFHSSAEINAKMMTMTAILSSNIIFNLQWGIGEKDLDVLSYIGNFSADVVKKHGTNAQLFEALTFLVRNWDKKNDSTFGDCTNSYLRDTLRRHLFSNDKMKWTVHSLKGAFAQMEGFLMPKPQRRVLEQLKDGEDDEQFISLTKRFVEQILSPENLTLKKSLTGNLATADHLLNWVASVGEMLVKYVLPNDIGIFTRVTTETAYNKILRDSISIYKDSLNEVSTNLTADEFKKRHELYKRTTLDTFEFNMRVFVDITKNLQTGRTYLEEQINLIFSKHMNNTKLPEWIKEEKARAVEKYAYRIISRFLSTVDKIAFVYSETLYNDLVFVGNKELKEFDNQMSAYVDRDIVDGKRAVLAESMTAIIDKAVRRNEVTRQKLDESCQQVGIQMGKELRRRVDEKFGQKHLTPAMLFEFYQRFSRDILSSKDIKQHPEWGRDIVRWGIENELNELLRKLAGPESCDAIPCDRNAECIYNGYKQYVCKCLPGFTGDGKTCTRNESAIQLVALEGSEIVLRSEALDVIPMQTNRTPLAIVSIVGGKESNESSIMDIFLHYIRKKGWENSNWFGDEKTDIIGEWKITSPGIYILPEVFYIPLEGDRNASVLLVYVHCVFAKKSSPDINPKLMALGSFLSSHQIMDLKVQINETDLENLQISAIFGQNITDLAQDWTILVRDFERYKEYRLGDSTNKYLRKSLQSISRPSATQKTNIAVIEKFFALRCFLIPRWEYNSWQSSTGISEIEENESATRQQITKKFVEEILNQRTIKFKMSRRGENSATAEVRDLMTKAVNHFKRKDKNLMKSMKLVQLGTLWRRCFVSFQNRLNQFWKNSTKKEFEQHYHEVSLTVVDNFESESMKICDVSISTEVENLKQNMSYAMGQAFDELKVQWIQNKLKDPEVHSAEKCIYENLIEFQDNVDKFERQNQGTYDENLMDTLKNMMEEKLRDFDNEMYTNPDKDVVARMRKALRDGMKNIMGKANQKNKEVKAELENESKTKGKQIGEELERTLRTLEEDMAAGLIELHELEEKLQMYLHSLLHRVDYKSLPRWRQEIIITSVSEKMQILGARNEEHRKYRSTFAAVKTFFTQILAFVGSCLLLLITAYFRYLWQMFDNWVNWLRNLFP